MEWAARWGMAFNTKKCKVMHVGRQNPRHQYTMGGHVLETTEDERDIGVQKSSNLKPGGQCGNAAMTANRVLGQVSRAFHYRDKDTFVRVYKLYVLPHLEFAVPAWHPWTKSDAETLEKVQRRAINMVSGLKSHDYNERLRELEIPTLTQRREELDMTEMYKIMTEKSAVDPSIWFEKASRDGVMTRQAADPLNVMIPAARLDIRKNIFSVRVCDKWNSLPSEIKNSVNVKTFNTTYRRHMNTCPP
jgi:ribonuclease P/MRP protein subunit RPP40